MSEISVAASAIVAIIILMILMLAAILIFIYQTVRAVKEIKQTHTLGKSLEGTVNSFDLEKERPIEFYSDDIFLEGDRRAVLFVYEEEGKQDQ